MAGRTGRKNTSYKHLTEHKRWEKQGGCFKGEVFSISSEPPLESKAQRYEMKEIKGEIGSDEWRAGVDSYEKEIKEQIELMKKMGKGNPNYLEHLRRWYELGLRVKKMVGDAEGKFGANAKPTNPNITGNTFVVVMHDGKTDEIKMAEKAEIIQEDKEDGE